MTSTITVYHNPRCSKSRATVEWLRQQNIDFEVVEYLKQPLDKSTLKSLADQLGVGPLDFMRTGEKIFKELCLDQGDHGDEALFDAMVKHPILLERPIVATGQEAAIGRPLDNVMEMINDL